MKIKDLKIGTQLWIGFAITMAIIIVMGVVGARQNFELKNQTQDLFNHPYKVRAAIGALSHDIDREQIIHRDMLLKINGKETIQLMQALEILTDDVLKQFDILSKQYLGPALDIEEARKAFLKWKVIRDDNNKLILSGEIEKAIENIKPNGKLGKAKEELAEKINLIDHFAFLKAEEFYLSSNNRVTIMNMELVALVFFILLVSVIVNLLLLRNIRTPLNELTIATQRFGSGDMNVRSTHVSKNDFGLLSTSFNHLAETIQLNTELSEKVASLASLMLSEYDPKFFFRAMLNALASHTDSQMAAIYLLSENKKTFDHFESVGLTDSAKESFSATTSDGEFGTVLTTHKVQHIKNISTHTRFVFYTVSGKFIPSEIIAIPVIANDQIIAIISLSNLSTFSNQSLQLIDSILSILSSRVEGILAYNNNIETLKKIEHQNIELEAQKNELSSQSSELTEQNAELEIQKKELAEASRLKTIFLSNMSHELRTPLNSVIALSGVLNRRLAKKITEEENSYLEVIERNGKNLLKLINDILDISRIEAGKEEIEIKAINAKMFIAGIIEMINPIALQKNISIIQTTTDSNIEIKTDANKLQHILQNIIANAVKFTEKGMVEVKSELNNDHLIITIIDTGIGIAEENISRIFEEFRQADGSTSRKYGGNGLGLSIAKKYTNLLGGKIDVKSTINEGSEFIVTLPVDYHLSNKIIDHGEISNFNFAPKYAQSISLGQTSTKTILLVEDSEPAIIQMKDLLEEVGYKIIVANNGEEALSTISNFIPDAIILDLMMPGIDGFELLNMLRAKEKTSLIPVLILTAKHITKDDLKSLKQNNVHQLIQKGDVNKEELLNTVSSMFFVAPKLENLKSKIVNPNSLISKSINQSTFKGKPLVLVVEDNADNMTTVKALLGDDYIVLEATDGIQGIELAKEHIPHLILMDIALPGMDGIEIFKVIRNENLLKHIPVIALTASAMLHHREDILSHGFEAYIPKPINDKLFFDTINEAIYGK